MQGSGHWRCSRCVVEDEAKLATMKVFGITVTKKELMHPNSRYALGHLARLWVDQDFEKRMAQDAIEADAGTQNLRQAAAAALEDMIQQVAPKGLKRSRSFVFASSEDATPEEAAAPPPPPTLLDKYNQQLTPLRLDDEPSLWEIYRDLPSNDRAFLGLVGVLASVLDGCANYKQWLFLRDLCAACDPPRIVSCWALARVRKRFWIGLSLTVEDFLAVVDGTVDTRWVPPWYDEFWMLLAAALCRSVASCLPCLKMPAAS